MLTFYLWIFQNVTALFLFFGLYVHIFIIPLTANLSYDLLFAVAAVYHGFNGLWGIIDESFKGKGWKVAEKFEAFFIDYQHNKLIGHFLFILHRLTGLFLLLYLAQHIITNSLISAYLSIDNIVITEFLKNDFLDYLAVLSLCFHAVNGIRLIFIELTSLTWLQRKSAYVSLALGMVFALYVTFDFGRRLF